MIGVLRRVSVSVSVSVSIFVSISLSLAMLVRHLTAVTVRRSTTYTIHASMDTTTSGTWLRAVLVRRIR